MRSHSSSARFVAALQFWLLLLLLPAAIPAWSQVSVLTQHNDNLRTGANLSETTLTTSNVNVSTFGKLFSLPVDGFTYAQPLYVPGLAIAGGTHNVVFLATAHNSVYAYDADSGVKYWQVNLGPSLSSQGGTAPVDVNSPNMLIEIGITATPVIDPATGTMYLTAKTKESGSYYYRLHALDITTGAEKFGGPTLIQAAVAGTGVDNVNGIVRFNALQENQRPAVTLVNGVIYLAFASHEDHNPYHGWVLAYSASTMAQIAAFNDTPNGGRGGIWMSGQGLVADAGNNIYLLTGNSTNSTENSAGDFGESFLKLTLSGSALSASDYFKPNNYDSLNSKDTDLGSGGAIGIPGTTYIVGGGKQGLLYLVDTANMGQLNLTKDQVVQEFQADTNLHGSPVFWNNASAPALYVWGAASMLKAYSFVSGLFNTTPASQSSVSTPSGTGCGALSVSSNGSAAGTGILWATAPLSNPDSATVNGTLYAFDATNVALQLWNSRQNLARDDYGKFAKFVPPTVADGKVFVGTDSSQVVVYGLLPPTPPTTPTGLAAASGNNVVGLIWTGSGTTYNIKRSAASGGPYTTIASGVSANSYTDSGLPNGITYFYVVTAVNNFGESAASNQASAFPNPGAVSILSLNFVGGSASKGTPAPMAASETAGVIPAANWNNGTGLQGSSLPLLDNFGLSAGASAAWTANNTWSTGITDTAGNNRMMGGYLDCTTTSTTTVSVSALPAAFTTNGYDVYVYCNGDSGAGRAGDYTLGSTKIQAQSMAVFSGAFTQANSSPGNYVKFSNLTAAGFSLTAHASATNGGSRAPVNGLQIVSHSPSISGQVSLQGWVGAPQPLTCTLTPTGATTGSVITQTITVPADGSFALSNVPAGTYTLGIKGSKWLRKNVAVDTTGGSVSGLSVLLFGGDADGNNKINATDYLMLRKAYNTAVGDANYEPRADFNGDGKINATDYLILRQNYNKIGD